MKVRNEGGVGISTNSGCVFVFLFILAWAGCVHVDQNLTLNPDGSGTLVWTYGVRQDALEQAGTHRTEDVPFSAKDSLPDEASIREGFKEFEPLGIRLESVRRDTRDGYETWELQVRFAQLEQLARSPLMSGLTMSLVRDTAGHYILEQSGGYPGWQEASSTEAREAERKWMAGFRAVISIATPGRIVEANATERTDNTATWVYDLEKDPDVLQKAGTSTIRVVFDGENLTLPCFASGL